MRKGKYSDEQATALPFAGALPAYRDRFKVPNRYIDGR
jgi:hypothetical protein